MNFGVSRPPDSSVPGVLCPNKNDSISNYKLQVIIVLNLQLFMNRV